MQGLLLRARTTTCAHAAAPVAEQATTAPVAWLSSGRAPRGDDDEERANVAAAAAAPTARATARAAIAAAPRGSDAQLANNNFSNTFALTHRPFAATATPAPS
mmetsp:Transcript_3963/g.8599  ORF Transcript_3963/g.8599 Transcript_3963/m.8599 type:complete len:103 (-) Transcript_3963:8-316(-)